MKLAGKSLAEIIKAPVNLLVVHTIDTQEPLLWNQLLNLLCKQCLIVSLPSYLPVYRSLSFCKDWSQTFLNRHVRSDQSFEWELSAAKQPLIYLKVEPILHCCSFFFLCRISKWNNSPDKKASLIRLISFVAQLKSSALSLGHKQPLDPGAGPNQPLISCIWKIGY